MRSSAILAAVLVPLALVGFGFTVVDPDPRLQIILDVSGSMAGDVGGEEKIQAARTAILATIDALQEGTLAPGGSESPYFLTALRLYGHNLPREPKEASCEDTELVIPFQPLDRARFVEVLNGAQPKGQTPIARSLREAAEDFGDIGEDPAVIILVSDGEETCGGDPVAAACDLRAQGFDLTVHTVGFDVGAEARRQLEGVAECTGGEYRDAGDADELGASLRELTAASLLIEKDRPDPGGRPIRGGDDYDEAVALDAGILYRLDHHQRQHQFDHFHIEAGSGQKVVATVRTGPAGVDIRGDSFSETGMPYAGIQIHGPDRTEIVADRIIGDPNESTTIRVGVPEGSEGRYYILVGNTYDDQHMNSPFQVEVVDQFDAGSGRDAGADDRAAVELEPGEHTAWFQLGDHDDYYRFRGRPGEVYQIRARPERRDMQIDLYLYDADGVQLARTSAPNEGAAVRVEDFAVEEEGDYVLRLEDRYDTVTPETEYTLELTRSGGEEAEDVEDPEEEGSDEEAEEAAASDGGTGGGGLSPTLIVLALLALGAALFGGILLGRRSS